MNRNILLHTLANVLVTIGTFIILTVTTFTIGPYIEGKYFPVTKDFGIDIVKETATTMIFNASGEKIRQCSLREVRALVGPAGKDTVKSKGAIWVVDDGVGPITRPLGKQDLGTWAIQPVGDQVDVYASYHCHGLWTTEAYLGSWSRTLGFHIPK